MPEDGQTLESLEKLFSAKIDYERQVSNERDRRYSETFTAHEKAVVVALNAINSRLDLLNESRQTIADMVANSPTRAETGAQFEGIAKELKNINTRLDRGTGSSEGHSNLWNIVVGVLATFALLVSAFMAWTHK